MSLLGLGRVKPPLQKHYRHGLNVTWSGYFTDQIAAEKAGHYKCSVFGFMPQKIRMAGGVTDPFDVRWLRLISFHNLEIWRPLILQRSQWPRLFLKQRDRSYVDRIAFADYK